MSKTTIRVGIIRDEVPGKFDSCLCAKSMNIDPDIRIDDLAKNLYESGFLPSGYTWVPVTDAKTIGELAAYGGVGSCVLKFIIGVNSCG